LFSGFFSKQIFFLIQADVIFINIAQAKEQLLPFFHQPTISILCFTNLKIFNISDTLVDKNALINFPTSMPNLQTLILNSCCYINDKSILKLFWVCRRIGGFQFLNVLGLCNCNISVGILRASNIAIS